MIFGELLFFFSSKEIPGFLTDVECDHLVSYAKRLGLEKSPLQKSDHSIDDETSERTFKIWDNNDDGFIEPVEVRPGNEMYSIFCCYPCFLLIKRRRSEVLTFQKNVLYPKESIRVSETRSL